MSIPALSLIEKVCGFQFSSFCCGRDLSSGFSVYVVNNYNIALGAARFILIGFHLRIELLIY